MPGVLPMVMAAAARGITRVFVPEPQAREAAMVPGMAVLGMRSLAQVVAELRGDEVPEAPPVAPMSGSRLLSWRGQERMEEVDLADLLGMADARYAVEVAAAGGHHLMLSGPKGAGKTTLAERIPGILPDLTAAESLELTAIHSLAGALEPGDDLLTRPPFSAPHHDASKASLIGGGTGRVRPGEISRAHCGVLFLDEFPLFRTDVIEALRQPLESGEITIARGDESATFPARGMVVLACNPCPCGDYSDDHGHQPVHVPRGQAPRLPARGSPARSPTGSTSSATSCRSSRTTGRDPWVASRVDRRGPGPGRAGAAAPGGPLRRPQLAAQRPDARAAAARRVAARPATPSAGSTTSCTPVGSAVAAPPGCTGSPGRSPTCAGVDRPGLAEVDVALRLRSGDAAADWPPLERRAG